MLFNSLPYLLFFPIVFILYWLIDYFIGRKYPSATIVQNIFLLIASYIFYAWWDWRFLGLLLGMSFISWLAGYLLTNTLAGGGMTHSRKIVMWSAVSIDLLTLGFFKYYNFFVESFCNIFAISNHQSAITIILPLGISFFTFQAISYVVDAYHQKLSISNNQSSISQLVDCFLYIGFFPKLLAGPIERPSHLIPQIQQRRIFTYELGTDGLRQILWGLFKKVVVADNCAVYVNAVYADYTNQSGSTLLLAAILYTIQIYGDFSGYSDMAIGSAKLLGFRFKDNFLFPYFSRNMGEFWKRWHISLNTWFVDYVYIPLGGSRPKIPNSIINNQSSIINVEKYTKLMTIRNTLIIFLLSGLWHGADWSFVAWGGYHGLLLVILILFGWNTKYDHVVAHDRLFPSIKELSQMLLVFILATIGWMMFRADNMGMFVDYCRNMIQPSLISVPWLMTRDFYLPLVIYIAVMTVVDWLYRKDASKVLTIPCRYHWVRWLIYYALIVICYYGAPSETIQFIYQQF
ncbi:MAG: MBOAT family protein [Paludibacteraceae bacterium]|nr:MBOAT family protein [Paludibacteraceae bacterium]